MKPIGTCPLPDVLETLATGDCTDEEVLAHVERCEVCRATVEEIRKDNQYLDGVRTALAAADSASPAHASNRVPEEVSAPLEPELVRGYQIEEEIHRGGQGVVYRAVQTRTRRTVAIKMLLGWHGANSRQRERFEREIRIVAGLRHPNIVTVYESGDVSDGRYGLVMEYIDGLTLNRWSRALDLAQRLDSGRGREARRQGLRARLGVMAKVCDAVLCAHQRSIVHRDLKPANILVDAAGEPHVLDFGIARDIGLEEHTRLTHTGEFAGTLAYASPEQVSGDPSSVDTRSDIYSLGVILYELVSGRMPYAVDGSMAEALRNVESAEPEPLNRRSRDADAPWVDGEVSTIVLKALAKDPARRYQSVAGLRDDINHYLAGEPIEARRDSTWYVLRKTAARHRVLVAVTALIMALLAVFSAAMAWQAHRLDVRGRELAGALSASNVELGRSLAAAGDVWQAESVAWPELIQAGVTHIDGPEAGFVGSPAALHAYWALWDIFRQSSCQATLPTHRMTLGLLYFDKSGRHLVGIDWNGELFSWSVETWEQERALKLIPPDALANVTREYWTFHPAVAPNGDIVFVGGRFIRVIDSETGDVKAQSDASGREAFTGTFSPDGSMLATIGYDKCLRLRDADSLATVVTMAEDVAWGIHPNVPAPPVFTPDGEYVAGALSDGSIGLWSTTTGTLERTLRPPDSAQYPPDSLLLIPNLSSLVTTIAFAPDGTIAAAVGDHLVVWPADESGPRDFGTPGNPILTLAFIPGSNGQLLISSGGTRGFRFGVTIIWDVATGGRVATFEQATVATACAVSSDGRLIAMADDDPCNVRVYSVSPEPHVTVLQSQGRPCAPGRSRDILAAVSPDGQRVAFTTPSDDAAERDVVVRDLKSGTTVSRFHANGATCGLEFAPDGKSVFECVTTGRITQRDLSTGTVVREFIAPDLAGPAASAQPAQRGATFRQAQTSGRPRMSADGSIVLTATDMRLNPDGTLIAQSRTDGLIGLWDVSTGQWIDQLKSGTNGLAKIDFSPDGETLAVYDSENCVLWNVRTRQRKRMISVFNYFDGADVRFSADGAIVARSVSGLIEAFDATNGRVLGGTKIHGTGGMAMVFHPRSPLLFASALDSSIRLWDIRTWRELLSLKKHTAAVTSLALAPDGSTLISADEDGLVLAWDLTYYNGPIRRELAYQARHAEKP